MKHKKYHIVGTIQTSNTNIVERDNIDTPYWVNTQIHDRSLPWLGTDTSIKSGGLN